MPLDPIAVTIIAVVALVLFVGLLAYFTRRTVKQSAFHFNSRVKQIPDATVNKLLTYLTPVQRAQIGEMLQRQRRGERLSDSEYALYTVVVAQAIRQLIEDDPAAAHHFRDML